MLMVLLGGLGMYLFGGSSLGLLWCSVVLSSLTSPELGKAAQAWCRMRESLNSTAWIGFVIGLVSISYQRRSPFNRVAIRDGSGGHYLPFSAEPRVVFADTKVFGERSAKSIARRANMLAV